MMRTRVLLTILGLCGAGAATAQRLTVRRYDATAQDTIRHRVIAPWRHVVLHYGKWLTVGATAGLTYLGAHEHQKSRREWDALLAICRSSQEACAIGDDGRYIRSDAERLYQLSRWYDRRANRRLLGAQLSLVATAALFIMDLRSGKQGPDNIPFSPLKVSVEPSAYGAEVGLQLAF